jgi:hypothetical protein
MKEKSYIRVSRHLKSKKKKRKEKVQIIPYVVVVTVRPIFATLHMYTTHVGK